MPEFTHMATAYILRWNKKDWKEIIGVFLTEDNLTLFLTSHFTKQECLDLLITPDTASLKVETGRYYERKY